MLNGPPVATFQLQKKLTNKNRMPCKFPDNYVELHVLCRIKNSTKSATIEVKHQLNLARMEPNTTKKFKPTLSKSTSWKTRVISKKQKNRSLSKTNSPLSPRSQL